MHYKVTLEDTQARTFGAEMLKTAYLTQQVPPVRPITTKLVPPLKVTIEMELAPPPYAAATTRPVLLNVGDNVVDLDWTRSDGQHFRGQLTMTVK
jgi:hypothetical protein